MSDSGTLGRYKGQSPCPWKQKAIAWAFRKAAFRVNLKWKASSKYQEVSVQVSGHRIEAEIRKRNEKV